MKKNLGKIKALVVTLDLLPVNRIVISATPSEQWLSPVSGKDYWETGWFDVGVT